MHINRSAKIMIMKSTSSFSKPNRISSLFVTTAILIMFICRLPYQIRKITNICKPLDILTFFFFFKLLGVVYFVKNCHF